MSSAGSASGEAGDEVPPSKHLKDRHARMEDETSLGAAEVDLALEGKSDGGELKGRWLTIPKGSMSLLYSHDKGAAPDLATGRVRIAAFDLDGTLITPKMLWQPFSKTRTVRASPCAACRPSVLSARCGGIGRPSLAPVARVS